MYVFITILLYLPLPNAWKRHLRSKRDQLRADEVTKEEMDLEAAEFERTYNQTKEWIKHGTARTRLKRKPRFP